MINIMLAVIVAYLIGSIPTSYLIGKTVGIDVRKEGSGNVGATNVLRTVGKIPALITLVIDILKGVVVVTVVAWFFSGRGIQIGQNGFRALLGLTGVAGHDWSIFLRWRGGKGVATTCGVLAILLPKETGIAALVFILAVWVTKYVSAASILLSMTIPVISVLSGREIEYVILSVTLCILISYKHKDNIKRLLTGTENKIKNVFC